MTESIGSVELSQPAKTLDENQPKETSENVPIEISKWRIWKNLFVICIAWVFLFTSFQGISNLQSSLNVKGNVGLNSMAIIYAFMIFSSVLLPHPLMSILGMKWTIVLCQFGYLGFIAANLYPKPALMYPISVFLGLSAAPLWTSEGAYLTQIGMLYAKIKNEKSEAGVSRFFGIFFAFFQTSQIWGNLISFLVLRPTSKPTAAENDISSSIFSQKDLIQNVTDSSHFNLSQTKYQCGAHFSEKEFHVIDDNGVPHKLVFTLCYILIALAFASIILIACLLDQRRKKEETQHTHRAALKNAISHMTSTLKQLKNIYQILLIPFTIWSGLEQAYISAQFTKAFITCSVGIKYVGLVLIVFGVCDALSSFSFGYFSKYIGRIYCLIIAALINYALIITMLIWIPSSNQIWVLFILAGLWGVADGCWQTQIGATYGVLFTEQEPAFSNFRLWESLGFVAAYVYSPRIRVQYTHIILLCVLTLAMLCYSIIEIMERRRKKIKPEEPSSSPIEHVETVF